MNGTGRKSYRKRILAVDDAATILLRITDTLEKYYDVVTVNSGARALRFLEKEKPDLILLDIRMTPKDGFETLREIRSIEDRADIPVIMLTGVEDKKPFGPEDLLERIQRALDPSKRDNRSYY